MASPFNIKGDLTKLVAKAQLEAQFDIIPDCSMKDHALLDGYIFLERSNDRNHLLSDEHRFSLAFKLIGKYLLSTLKTPSLFVIIGKSISHRVEAVRTPEELEQHLMRKVQNTINNKNARFILYVGKNENV